MKLSQFNPKTEVSKFMPVRHPVSGESIPDESGTIIGLDIVSANSKTAKASYKQYSSDVVELRQRVWSELGRPEDVAEIKSWDIENESAVKEAMQEELTTLMKQHLARCCLAIHGNIELDSGAIASSPIEILTDSSLEWVADQVMVFHNKMDNWVPKLQGS